MFRVVWQSVTPPVRMPIIRQGSLVALGQVRTLSRTGPGQGPGRSQPPPPPSPDQPRTGARRGPGQIPDNPRTGLRRRQGCSCYQKHVRVSVLPLTFHPPIVEGPKPERAPITDRGPRTCSGQRPGDIPDRTPDSVRPRTGIGRRPGHIPDRAPDRNLSLFRCYL